MVIFDKTLPNIKNLIDKHWRTLSVHEKSKKHFDRKPFIAFRNKKKNLPQIIAGSHILKSKVVCKNNENDKQCVFKMILHVKVKISHIYSNVEYVNFNRLEKGKLLLTSV